MGLGVDAKSTKLSIAMIVLGLVYLLLFILEMKLGIKLLLIPHGMILIGYIVVTILLIIHYLNLAKQDPTCDDDNNKMCNLELRYFSVLYMGSLSSIIMISVFLMLLNKMVLHI